MRSASALITLTPLATFFSWPPSYATRVTSKAPATPLRRALSILEGRLGRDHPYTEYVREKLAAVEDDPT
jgi:hypothetical protein